MEGNTISDEELFSKFTNAINKIDVTTVRSWSKSNARQKMFHTLANVAVTGRK